MARFHINGSGDAGLCRATAGKCPFGGTEDHYGSIEEAREAFEHKMEAAPLKKRSKQPHKDMFISILTSNQEVLMERFGNDLDDLEPGEYSAQYYDEASDSDKFITIKVSEGKPVHYNDVAKFTPSHPLTSAKTLTAFREADEAYHQLNADPTYCAANKIDRVTLLESSKGFERVLAKYDLTKAEDATFAKLELEDLEWALDHDLELAERDGRVEELQALQVAKEPLSKLLDSFKR